MHNRQHSVNHDQALKLLPWYVNETLTHDERSSVLQHLRDCAECRTVLDEWRAIGASVNRQDVTPIIPEPDADRLLSRLGQPPTARYWRRPLLLAASVAGLMAVAVGVLVGDFRAERTAPRYQTATSAAEPATMDYVVDVTFATGLSRAERRQRLRTLDASNEGRTVGEATLRVVIRRPASSLQQLNRYMEEVLQTDGIEAVQIVAIQLPVEPGEQ